VQLGFVIDHSRCIGCHACTVACKSENDVPLGDFRTWVKYVEEGEFPQVRRSFAVLRCNQCSNAPCVTICPVTALDKRADGIVDVDPDVCIGCKACMHGCPYDALYIDERHGTAEKCHFCAHRTERGLAPACAVVCPTEAIVPGDFHDPQSRVSRMRAELELSARKVEAGTGPNVFYRDVAEAGIQPGLTNGAGGYLWSDRTPGPQLDAQTFEALEKRARARTTYDVPRKELWGTKITGYLFTKAIAAGLFVVGYAALARAGRGPGLFLPLAALLFLAATGALLIADLKRPERFFTILTRPNWSSWLARGTFIIVAYSALLALWVALALAGASDGRGWQALLALATVIGGFLTAAYTAWLFGQAKGRVLWMRRFGGVHLAVEAVVAGASVLLLLLPLLGWPGAAHPEPAGWLGFALIVHLALTISAPAFAPAGREEEYARAVRLVDHGPYAPLHWGVGVGVGILLPLLVLTFANPLLVPAAGVLALVGLWVECDVHVRAGQALPIS